MKWLAQVGKTGLTLTLVHTTSNKSEQARARRLDVQHEIEQRTVEAAALKEQLNALADELSQVA
jgi:uncharacterized protein YlxW (UPF0749 family)